MYDCDNAWRRIIDQLRLPQTGREWQCDPLLFNTRHSSARLGGGERHNEPAARVLLDCLPLSHRLGNSRAPCEFDGERRAIGVAREWLRCSCRKPRSSSSFIAAMRAVSLSARSPGDDAGQLGELGDDGGAVLRRDGPDLSRVLVGRAGPATAATFTGGATA